jgi:hypothetical protein
VRGNKSRRGKMKKVFLTIIFCLLVSTTANAQCAWVLWERSYPILDEWIMIDGFQTHDQCKKAKKDAYETRKRFLLNLGYKVTEEMEGTLSAQLSFRGRLTSPIYTSWMCLPDTVDPRK